MSPLSLLKQYNIIFAELRQIEAARPSESSLQSRLQHMQAGSIKFHDARQLVRLLETLRPQRILEVGSFVGVSSRLLLEASTPWQAEVVALDPNMRHRGIDQPAEVVRALNHAFLGKRLAMVEAFSTRSIPLASIMNIKRISHSWTMPRSMRWLLNARSSTHRGPSVST